ncbi:hypothetical protein BV898_19417 [Hypsibius exemplaris]|uniref:Uncharacterized protein n=1 Tax=Hypsibius exemplaris TaxID=2072580 RepID=A0A9X6NJ20_HYPEX|nr:hypothetical protein BV898_19417 [Hypsibius exemplaris]
MLVPAPPAAAFQRSSSPEFPPPYGLINMPEDFGDKQPCIHVCLWIRSNLRFSRRRRSKRTPPRKLRHVHPPYWKKPTHPLFRPSLGIALTAVFSVRLLDPNGGFRFS